MVNFNGQLYEDDQKFFNQNNRGLRYGDSLFETIRVVKEHIYFLEDHYLRLMSSMRILRMEIPMSFTMEFLEDEIKKTIAENPGTPAHRVRLTVFRNDGGLYTPVNNDISYIIEVNILDDPFYVLKEVPYEIELFKDFYLNSDMLSNLKTNNRIINVVAGVYAEENDYQNCLLLNRQKQVVEAINGNVFVVSGKMVKTPPLADGCLNGIIRKKLIDILKEDDSFSLEENSISPFELQKVDEIFITNTIHGIIPVTKYRKKDFTNTISKKLIGRLNAVARLVV
ncbi:aminotransferase class IV [Maribacter sp. PR1]|uniref:branched-chain-amino-acid transaminase n=1 Tax=Maribacter cobaltidurans TaxID=1178778 RepID=A0ABU7ITG0_9FLAO|nr:MULTISPECIES: aminotransferase class IV [Maribacter]MDC6388672.1 aminotransferase class IV [Maribacter sp. PR1]MEE1976061.1 aminotransferase class IV [Maribacter cobaltidurans]